MPDQQAQPRDDELEVSLFGPGYGEAIVVHAGHGQWIAIDSCIDSTSREPKTVRYLKQIGVDPGKQLQIVVATHWHDDHIRGMSDLLNQATSAAFCCSRALTGTELIALAELYGSDQTGIPRGPRELHRCLELIEHRIQASGASLPLRYAAPDRVLWQSEINETTRLCTLSPSDEMDRRCIKFMSETLDAAKRGVNEGRLVAGLPNDVAVAMRLDIDERSILFGSDLERGSNNHVGWAAVLQSRVATSRKSSPYKVSHHGSDSGYHSGVWQGLVTTNPIALLSPFRLGRHKIPTPADRQTVLKHTSSAFITADPNQTVAIKAHRKRKAGDLANRTARNRRVALAQVGQIRWRASASDPSDQGTIDLFDGAMPLNQVA